MNDANKIYRNAVDSFNRGDYGYVRMFLEELETMFPKNDLTPEQWADARTMRTQVGY